jgi:hypothetical protein
MKRLQRAAIIVTLIEKLRENESWCGETNVQKATYFLEELAEVPLGFEFILFKHGPYSFGLKEELTALRADFILELRSPNPKYGPSFFPGKMRDYVIERFPKTVERFSAKLDFVASHLGRRDVNELECLSTALYVLRESSTLDQEQRAKKITKYKPHIDFSDSMKAVKEVDQFIVEVEVAG